MKYDRAILEEAVRAAMAAFAPRPPLTLTEWAEQHFYLSAESSYVEQKWRAWWFQRPILAAMGDDRVEEVTFRKSARVGATAMMLSAIGYFAQYRRRNQAFWQPTDDDRDEFVKTSVDPMLRDVAVMREVLPQAVSRHRDNTLQLKRFTGSALYLRGGKAAKNYRRISVDVAYIDEADAFDRDIEKEGDPFKLAWKRTEGATFRKRIAGSTPKEAGTSLIQAREDRADVRYRYEIQCPDCDGWHELTWSTDPDAPAGLRWVNDDPATVRHLCPHCATLIDQGQYLAAVDAGRRRCIGDDGSTITDEGVWLDMLGIPREPPRHVAFFVWTAYSPAASWADIVREYLDAEAKVAEGDDSALKAFTNTTLGLVYAGEVDRTDADDLIARAEPFPLRICPRDCLLLLAGVDTQDNRLEVGVWGYGRGAESWTIDHRVIYGDPGQGEVWAELEDWFLGTTYTHIAGTELKVSGMSIDSGGHNTHAVYEFARKHRARDVYATKGRNRDEKAIKDGAAPVDIDWQGKKRPKGVILWHVGTNLAKDLIYSRLSVTKPGPGYIHLSNELPQEWFLQFAAEVRRTAPNGSSRWTPIRRRNEALDCRVGVTWLEEHMELRRKPESWWLDLENRVRPPPLEVLAPAAPPVVQAAVREKHKISVSSYFGRR
jgi:phage terminase large subunit GpA-like protein